MSTPRPFTLALAAFTAHSTAALFPKQQPEVQPEDISLHSKQAQ